MGTRSFLNTVRVEEEHEDIQTHMLPLLPGKGGSAREVRAKAAKVESEQWTEECGCQELACHMRLVIEGSVMSARLSRPATSKRSRVSLLPRTMMLISHTMFVPTGYVSVLTLD